MLSIVATPIGNLQDITLRALDTLSSADVIYAEDTRVAGKLLSHYHISKPIRRYDEHSHVRVEKEILSLLEQGKHIALVSDAGTPGISDPGARLVQSVRAASSSVRIVPVPGVSALTTLLSIAGIDLSSFVFLGFPPHKKGRTTFFKMVASSQFPVVLYESPHRVQKTFEMIRAECGEMCIVVVGRELTKLHEDIFWGTVKDASLYFVGEKLKGEFVLLVERRVQTR